VVVAPWTIRNLVTFKRPVFLAGDLNGVIAGANSPTSYRGPGLGGWHRTRLTGINTAGLDESQIGAILRHKGVDYALGHKRRWPVVVAARVGRTWNLFRPLQSSDVRYPKWLTFWSVVLFFVLQPLAVVGAVKLRRHGRPVMPLLAQAVVVTVVAVLAYGIARLRIPWDVATVVLAGVGISAPAGHAKNQRKADVSRGTIAATKCQPAGK
jgi:hypothetical protein